MNKKALAVLEYDKIINMLRDCAGSEMAKARIAMFRPSSDPYKIKERQAETTEAVAVITAKGALPVGQLYDIENALHFARKGGSLTMKQLLQVLYNMKVTGEIVSFLRSDLPELPILDGMREVLVPFPRLADRIDRCILSEDEMAERSDPQSAESDSEQSGQPDVSAGQPCDDARRQICRSSKSRTPRQDAGHRSRSVCKRRNDFRRAAGDR